MKNIFALLSVIALAGIVHAEDKVELNTIKLKGLHEAIAAHKGKIVVVDFWATFCIPCKKEFPNLVKLHKEHGDKGLVCISVTVDDPEEMERALKFLTQQKAAFPNYLLDEPAETYQKELGFGAVPCVMVYGKDGKLVKKFTADEKEFTYKEVREFVDSLLKYVWQSQ